MTDQIQTPEHPDPDRWWRKKFILACTCTTFAGIVLLIGLFYAKDSTLVIPGVWAFMVPMLAFLGLAEANNIWGQR